VIELALSRKIVLQINVALVRPPYKSAWLLHIPTDDELEAYTAQAEEVLRENNYGDSPSLNQWRSVFAIQNSLFEYGDFSRYVIGTNYSASFSCNTVRLILKPCCE
jgi:hypothetical protein